ncbi:MAG: maleylpyruvate isomerase family mycothiol-dependent enzyme [Actinomycetes bacterium]
MQDPDRRLMLEETAQATTRLLASARLLTDADLRGPSTLPDWSRAHVLTHVARNADSCTRLLTWATTGQETPQYASREDRDSEIAYRAMRPLDEQLTDLDRSAARFTAAAHAVPPDRWEVPVRWLSGAEHPAHHVLWARWREVEIHHVDLDTGYDSADWPDAFTAQALDDVVDGFRLRADAPDLVLEGRDSGRRFALGEAVGLAPADVDARGIRTVSGPEHRLVAWLAGRADGRMLVVTPAGPMPAMPSWL